MARLLLLLLALLSTQVLATQVHRFSTPSVAHKDVLERFVRAHPGSEIWDNVPGSHADVMLLEEHIHKARHLPVKASVFIHSVEDLIQASTNEEAVADADDFHAKYHSASEYHAFLGELAAKHQNTELVQVGTSVLGKNMVGLRIGDKSKPEILLQGGQHAREWIAPGSLAYAAEALIQADLKGHSVMLIPLANPDGYDYTRGHSPGQELMETQRVSGNAHASQGNSHRMWRKNLADYTPEKEELMETQGNSQANCFGTDLNRQWATGSSFPQVKAGQEVSSSECSDTYEGKAPLDQKEAKHLSAYIQARQKQGAGIATFVDVHSYSQKIIPVGCNDQQMTQGTRDKHLKLTKSVATSMSQVHGKDYTSGECAKIMYACSGVAHDWAHFDGKVPNSMAIELRDKGSNGFVVPPSMIKPTGQEMVAAVHTIALAQQQARQSLIEWAESDHRLVE